MQQTLYAGLAALLLVGSPPAGAQQSPGDDPSAEMQRHFAEAYNRGDIPAMVDAFTENAIRVTPSGIFQGRDAIRRSFQAALDIGLHDYTVKRTLSRSDGRFIFNTGEWRAKLGDKPFHGYYTATVVHDGDRTRIMEETVTVAVP
ncbi:MAG: nuclear transport factor 2 family protein [Xanthobacteraceae bacterium]